ncbi:MAG: right-handed parallel beta-helix repeat-containing protein, partial [Chitinophagaceae bacterium]|nr:right-handed parallel beta-helix repeat-containing protein [Chitinophagaceae bacterium]
MKRFSLFFILWLFVFLNCDAQVPTYFTANAGGTGNAFPLNNNTTSRKVQWFIPPGALTGAPAGNNITTVYFRTGTAATKTFPLINIKMKVGSGTGLTGIAGGPVEPGMSVVYTSVNQTITSVAQGWIQFTLNTPFAYDPTLPLIVELEHNAASGTGPTVLQNPSIPGPGNGRQWADYNGVNNTGVGANLVHFGVDLAPGGPCVAPPTAGISTATPAIACVGADFTLNLTGNSAGVGQTYQWESSVNIGGPYTVLSGLLNSPSYITPAISNLYYRCAVTCSGNTQYSTPVLVTAINGLSGTYTINSALPTGGLNFHSFTDAVGALNCGVAGPVVFNVVSGSGPYNEQISISQLLGSSAINTVTFNGNGETLTFNATLAAAPHTMLLNGADFIKVNNLNIVGIGATYALACHLWNNADNNRFTNCTFTSPANGTATTQVPFSISGSATVATTSGVSGSNDTLDGCTMNSGYYNTCIVGNSGGVNTGNYVNNCHVADFYFYGIYCYYQNGVVISNNLVDRPTRTTVSTFYGIYILTGNTNALVEKNRIRNPFGASPGNAGTAYAIYSSIDGTIGNENRYYNNVISNMESNGIVGGFYLTGADYVKVYHNTISLDDAAATAGTTYGIFNSGTVGGIDIRNNIVSITRGGSGTKYCLYYSLASVVSNKNVLYLNSPAGVNYTGYFSGLTYASLANWQTANGNLFDQQSSAANPLYFSPPTNDYTPTELSFNNLGDAVGVLTDITGFNRSVVSPDPGAYEFANANFDISTTALVSPDNSGCYGANQNVVISIVNSGIQTIDFSLSPTTVTCNITGALVATVSAIVNAGTLAPGATLNVTLNPAVNMTANGTYTFNATAVMPGDANAGNNILNPAVTRTVGVAGGTISSNLVNICVSGTPTLTAVGASGGALQWKESTISPAGPWTNVGAGLATYTPGLPVTQTTYYQLDVNCNANTASSNTYTVTVNNPLINTTTADTVCAGNAATLAATANVGNISWFAGPIGGVALYTGSPFTTPVLNNTTTYYVETSVGGGGGNASPILVTEMDLGTNDRLEIQNVSPDPVNVTGWKVYVSNDYANITAVNANVQTLSGTMNPGDLMTWTDLAAGPNYWGSNILWNPGAYPTFTGWAAIIDNNNVLRDIVFMNWPAANIAGANIVMGGISYAVGNFWSGGGVDIAVVAAANSVARGGTSDNNALSDFSIPLLSINLTNPQMTIPFSGFGCAGTRVAVTALVNPTPVITSNPATAVVCESVNLTLSGGGAGVGGTYVWTGGVTDGVAFPATVSTIYTVTGTSAAGCSGTATSDIIVNPIISGTATANPATICLGQSTTLNSVIPTICAGNVSGFAGAYAPANWIFSVVNSNGTVNAGGAPANIVISTGTNASGLPGTTSYTRTIGCAGTVSFNWNYTNADAFGSIFDYPRYTINGGAPVTFPGFVIGGANSQNGVESIILNAGDVLALQMYTIDNDPTPGFTTITNFSAPAAPIGGTVSFWDSPSGGINLGVPPLPVTPAAAGTQTYYAEYTALGTGCVNPNRDPVIVTINGNPTVTASASPAAICPGGSSTLTGGGAATYAWDPGALVGNPSVSPVATTNYTVTGTDA